MKLRYHSWQPLLVLVVLAGILLAAWRAFLDPSVNRASFQRIEVGMSKDQVNQLLGRPADSVMTLKAMWRAHSYSALDLEQTINCTDGMARTY